MTWTDSMNHDTYDDNYIREILNGVKTIAMVGASPVNVRPSYFAFKYLAQRGYDMIPINPGQVGKSLVGKPFVASLRDIDRPIDMVDIFRNADAALALVDEALSLNPLPKVIWMQLGVRNDVAAVHLAMPEFKIKRQNVHFAFAEHQQTFFPVSSQRESFRIGAPVV